MAEMRTLGLASVKMGTTGTNGTMGTTLTSVGTIVEGTVILQSDNPAVYEDRAEGYMNALFVQSLDLGKTTFAFSLKDTSAANMAKYFGGTVVGSKWTAPTAPIVLTQSIEVISKSNKYSVNGQKYEIPAGQVQAKFNIPFTKDKAGQIDVLITVLSPVNGSGVEQPALFITDL